MSQIINFPSKGILNLSITKGRYGIIVQVARDTTILTAQGIVALFLDPIDIVQITGGLVFLDILDLILFCFLRAFFCYCIFFSVLQNFLK